jgi:hypothetical protein
MRTLQEYAASLSSRRPFCAALIRFVFSLFPPRCSVVDRQCQSFIANIAEGAKLEPFIVDGKDAEEVLPCELGSPRGTALAGQRQNFEWQAPGLISLPFFFFLLCSKLRG